MKRFIIKSSQFSRIMTLEESNELFEFFKKEKFIDKFGVLSIRFFMYYQNCIIPLPDKFEPKRKEIFEALGKLGYTERDFMQSKVDFKRKPIGYKD